MSHWALTYSNCFKPHYIKASCNWVSKQLFAEQTTFTRPYLVTQHSQNVWEQTLSDFPRIPLTSTVSLIVANGSKCILTCMKLLQIVSFLFNILVLNIMLTDAML